MDHDGFALARLDSFSPVFPIFTCSYKVYGLVFRVLFQSHVDMVQE